MPTTLRTQPLSSHARVCCHLSSAAVSLSRCTVNFSPVCGSHVHDHPCVAVRLPGPHGIRVNSLNPTLVNSGMGKWAGPEAVAGIASRIPLGRIAEEHDVVTAALFLLEAEMVSGHSLPLDGGSSTRL